MNTTNKSISGSDATLDARLRALPSVTTVLNTEVAIELARRFGRKIATEAVRAAVDDARIAIKSGAPVPDADYIARQTLAGLDQRDHSSLRPLFNLTGTPIWAARFWQKALSKLRPRQCATPLHSSSI